MKIAIYHHFFVPVMQEMRPEQPSQVFGPVWVHPLEKLALPTEKTPAMKIDNSWLVVLTILKNMKVNGKDYPRYYGKYKMFETTNQIPSGFRVATGLPFLDFQADLELKLGTLASAIQSSYLGTREPSSSHWFLWMLGISPKKNYGKQKCGWWLANEWNVLKCGVYIYI